MDPETCGCVCPEDIACPVGKSIDPASCLCECDPPVVCAAPKVEDPETCTCICPPEVAYTANRTLDPKTCECVCPAGTSLCDDACVAPCLPTEAMDDECRCVPIVCPPDRVLTCTCACPPGTAECKGSCVPTCGADQVFDAACRCACQPNISCAAGLELDPATCGCICAPTTCPAGKRLDPATCQCVCPETQSCPTGRKLDPVTCTCVCDVDSYPPDRVMNSSCRCVCPPSITCAAGQQLNPETCTCARTPGSLIETVDVPCARTPVVSATTLQAGMTYSLRASETCTIGYVLPYAPDADAEYAFDPSNPMDLGGVTDRCLGSSGYELGIGIDDPVIDGSKTPTWGPYNSSHVYMIGFAGKGAPITLNYHDCVHRDNAGSLKVEIFCPGTPTGEPTGSGDDSATEGASG